MKQQIAHLNSAWESGFTHFDTSPLYGFGLSETALGNAFKNKQVTIATKVGLYPPGGANQGRYSILARKVVGKVLPYVSRAVADVSVAHAQNSFEQSLRRLRREYVDFLFLHEPAYSLLNTDEWHRWLEQVSDKCSYIGIAGPDCSVRPFLENQNALGQVIQIYNGGDSPGTKLLHRHSRQPQFTYGYLSGITGSETAETVLRTALGQNESGSIIVSTRNKKRLPVFGELSSNYSG